MAVYVRTASVSEHVSIVNTNVAVQVDSKLFDTPAAVSIFHLSCACGYDVVAGCSVLSIRTVSMIPFAV